MLPIWDKVARRVECNFGNNNENEEVVITNNNTNTTAGPAAVVSITPVQQQQQQRQQHRGVTAGILPFLETDIITQEMETLLAEWIFYLDVDVFWGLVANAMLRSFPNNNMKMLLPVDEDIKV